MSKNPEESAMGIGMRIVIVIIILGLIVVKMVYNKNYNDYLKHLRYTNQLRVTVDINTEVLDYYHLGANVGYDFWCNGHRIYSGKTIKLRKQILNFTTEITEYDTIPDYAYSNCRVKRINYYNGGSFYTDITVYEHGGRRYPDAYATYRVTYTITPKIDEFWSVVFYNDNYAE